MFLIGMLVSNDQLFVTQVISFCYDEDDEAVFFPFLFVLQTTRSRGKHALWSCIDRMVRTISSENNI